jgi:hypothetical protein
MPSLVAPSASVPLAKSHRIAYMKLKVAIICIGLCSCGYGGKQFARMKIAYDRNGDSTLSISRREHLAILHPEGFGGVVIRDDYGWVLKGRFSEYKDAQSSDPYSDYTYRGLIKIDWNNMTADINVQRALKRQKEPRHFENCEANGKYKFE